MECECVDYYPITNAHSCTNAPFSTTPLLCVVFCSARSLAIAAPRCDGVASFMQAITAGLNVHGVEVCTAPSINQSLLHHLPTYTNRYV